MSYMDSHSSLENLNTVVIWTSSKKKSFTIKPVPKSIDESRCSTDKYWIGFFLIIFISWIVAWQYAIVHHETNYNIHSNNSIANDAKNQFDHHETDRNIFFVNSTKMRNISEISPQTNADIRVNPCIDETMEKKQHFNETNEFVFLIECFLMIFDIFTYNPSRLGRHDETGLIIEIPVGSFVTVVILLAAIDEIRNNRVFREQTSIIGAILLFITLIEHLSIVYHSRSNTIVSPLLPFHEKLAGWMIPEILFIMLWFSQTISIVYCEKSEDSLEIIPQYSNNVFENENKENNDSSVGCCDNDFNEVFDTNDDDEDDDTDVGIIPFHNYVYAIIFGFPFIVLLKLVLISTISILYKMTWNNPYPYIIAGGSIYLSLTFYYFGLMLTAYATNILMDTENLSLKDLLRTLFIVSRYHFGTACYHGTLIFPRLRATFIMNESEFKEIPKELRSDKKSDDKFDRESDTHNKYYVAHYMVYRFSPTLTATHGYSLYNSIKESFRLCKSVYSKKQYFYGYGRLSLILLILLLTTNKIIILILLSQDSYDSTFANATWTMYIKIMFLFMVAMSFFKTVADTIGLRLFGIQVKTIESTREGMNVNGKLL